MPHQRCTCKPAFLVPVLSVFHPQLVPRVGKVDEENKLNDNKDEGSNDSKVKPHYGEGMETHPVADRNRFDSQIQHSHEH